MDKEKIFSELKTRIGETSLSDRTLMTWVEKNLPAEGVEPDDAYWEKGVSLLQSLGGQYSHDVAAFVAKHGGKQDPDPNHDPDPNQGDGGNEGNNDALKMLSDLAKRYDELKARMDADAADRDKAKLLGLVKGEMERRGCDNAYVLEHVLNDADLDGKKPMEKLVEEQLARYDSEYARAFGSGVQPRGSMGGGGGKSAADAYFAKKWKQRAE